MRASVTLVCDASVSHICASAAGVCGFDQQGCAYNGDAVVVVTGGGGGGGSMTVCDLGWAWQRARRRLL